MAGDTQASLARNSGEIAADDEIIIIGKKTAVLPADRESRLIAMRLKGLEYVQELVRHDMIDKKTMLGRLKQTDLEDSIRRIAQARIRSFFRS